MEQCGHLMNNYELINISYAKSDLQNIFTNTDEVIRPCTSDEVLHISKLFKLKYISRILYFSMYPSYYSTIHIDRNINSTFSLEFALNIPVTNGNTGYMNWFNQLENQNLEYYSSGALNSSFPHLNKNNARLIDTVKLNSPMFVKINDWHNIENRSEDTLEKIISIRFNQMDTIDNIKSLLK
jgi:hypothetical protein